MNRTENKTPSVSVVIPVLDEARNLPAVFQRLPQMGPGTELVFVEGHSTDSPYEIISRLIGENPVYNANYSSNLAGARGTVRLGLSHSAGELLMILDADLSVPLETLPQFYDALLSRQADFANGERFDLPME